MDSAQANVCVQPYPPAWLSLPALAHPWKYFAFIVVSSLDVVLTWVVLSLGGAEVNPIADFVIKEWGVPGVILYKYCLTLFVIIVCEEVGRRHWRNGRNLALVAIAVSSLPVVLSLGQIALHTAAMSG